MKELFGVVFTKNEYQRLEPLIPTISSMGSQLPRFWGNISRVCFMSAFLEKTSHGQVPDVSEIMHLTDEFFNQAVADIEQIGKPLKGHSIQIGNTEITFDHLQ